MLLRKLGMVLLLGLLVGCTSGGGAEAGKTAKTPEAEKQTKTPEAEKQSQVPVIKKTVYFTPKEATPNDAGQLELCLDCDRRSATYTYCLFDEAKLEAAVGEERMNKKIQAVLAMVKVESKKYVPDDPNAPQPEGGFSHKYYTCTVLEGLPSE